MADTFSNYHAGLESPAERAFAITPSDTNALTYVTRGIYIGVTGDVKVEMVSGGLVTFKNALAGTVLPVRALRVWSTGTDATDLIGLV